MKNRGLWARVSLTLQPHIRHLVSNIWVILLHSFTGISVIIGSSSIQLTLLCVHVWMFVCEQFFFFLTPLNVSGMPGGAVVSPVITRKDRCCSTHHSAFICAHTDTQTPHCFLNDENSEVTPKSDFMRKALIHFPPLKSYFHFTAQPNIKHDSTLNVRLKCRQL